MEDETFDQVLDRLANVSLDDNECAFVEASFESVQGKKTWEQHCCYGLIVAEKPVPFRSMKLTLERIWSKMEFTVSSIEQGLLQFFFKGEEDLKMALDKSPWAIDQYLLILVKGKKEVKPTLEAFESVEGWGQLWGFNHCAVNEEVARDLLQLPDAPAVQLREVTNGGKKFFRIKFKINITKPLRKCIFLRFEGQTVESGSIRYEKFPVICFNCGIIGHQKSSCPEVIKMPSDDALLFGKWIKADSEITSKLSWSSESGWVAGASNTGDQSFNELGMEGALMPVTSPAGLMITDTSMESAERIRNPIVRSLIQNWELQVAGSGGRMIKTGHIPTTQDLELGRWLSAKREAREVSKGTKKRDRTIQSSGLLVSESSSAEQEYSEDQMKEDQPSEPAGLVQAMELKKHKLDDPPKTDTGQTMPPLSEKELEENLAAAGNSLLRPSSSVEELLPLLDRVEGLLSEVEQSPSKSMQNALSPLMKALVAEDLLEHSNVDVKVGVASCISEITRITAPEAPYGDDKMKAVFQLIVSSFENFSDASSRSHGKRATILETVAKVRSCVIMLDLECDQMIIEMFQHFLKEIRVYHDEVIFAFMETIMTLVLEESEDISQDLLSPILATLKKNNQAVLPIAKKLAKEVIQKSADKIAPYLKQAVKSLGASLDDYSEIVSTLCQEKDDADGHTDEHILKAQLVAKDGTAEANFQDKGPVVDRSLKITVRDDLNEIGTEETVTDENSSKIDDSNHKLDVKTVSDTVSDDCVAQKSIKSEATLEHEETKQVPCNDEIIGEDVHISSTEVKPEAAKSLDCVQEIPIQLFPSVPPEKETREIAYPTQSGGLLDGSQAKEDSLEKMTENLVAEDRASVDPTSKASEGEHVSEPKKQRRSGKKQSEVTANTSRTMVSKGTSNNDDGSTSNLGKSQDQTDQLGNASDKMEEASSLRKEDRKKNGRVKTSGKDGLKSRENRKESMASLKSSRAESTPEGTKEMSNKRKRTPGTEKDSMASLKSSGAESTPEGTKEMSNKRKRTPGKEKASGSIEYGENLINSRVKVWWPKDRMFYEGVIASFDAVKKKHQVLYVDGDEEVLNLKKERWEFITDDMVSDKEQDGENSTRHTAPDTPAKKKVNKNSETLSDKRRKVEGSLKSKLKDTAATKAGSKSKKQENQQSESETKDISNIIRAGRNASKSKDQPQKKKERFGRSKDASVDDNGKDDDGDGDRDDDDAVDAKTASQKRTSGATGKTKGNTPKSRGRKPGSGKSGLSKAKETTAAQVATDQTKEKTHPEQVKPSEMGKGKSTDTSATKSRETETKSGKKRRR